MTLVIVNVKSSQGELGVGKFKEIYEIFPRSRQFDFSEIITTENSCKQLKLTVNWKCLSLELFMQDNTKIY